MLLTLELAIHGDYDFDALIEDKDIEHMFVTGPRKIYDALQRFGNHETIERAFRLIGGDRPPYTDNKTWLIEPSSGLDWMEQSLNSQEGGGEVNNQGIGAEQSQYHTTWQGLKFRSTSETRVAEALEKRAVLYFPLCAARLGLRNSRETREPDFLVCYKGKWGILEVDGPQHTGRAAKDHERDRLFKNHDIKVIEHYDADKCFENADRVVNDFLNILDRLG